MDSILMILKKCKKFYYACEKKQLLKDEQMKSGL